MSPLSPVMLLASFSCLLLLFNSVSGQISLQPPSFSGNVRNFAQREAQEGEDEATPTVARRELEFDANRVTHETGYALNGDARVDPRAIPLTTSRCGVNFMQFGGHKIVGGRSAVVGEYPWQVSLQTTKFGTKMTHYCGAAILSSEWIVTAAHCVEDFQANEIQAVAGAFDLRRVGFGSDARTGIKKIVKHAGYEPSQNLVNDIALLKVSIPFDLSANSLLPINSVCLPEKDSEFTGYATVSGWGKVDEDGNLSDTMRAVNVSMMTDEACRLQYGNRIMEKMACAGFDRGGKDACQGDSGGPLVKLVNGRYTLIGVVSWGIGCARAHSPGVYTQVSRYINWIQEKASTN